MTFQLWGTDLMGMPDVATIPSYFIISNRFYLLSLALQITFFVLFFYVIAFAFYRAIKNLPSPNTAASMQTEQASNIDHPDKEQRKPQQDLDGEIRRDEEKKKEKVGKSLYAMNKNNMEMQNSVHNFEDDDEDYPKIKQQPKDNKDQQEEEEQNQNSDDSDGSDEDDDEDSDQGLQQKKQTEQQLQARLKLFRYQDSIFKLAPWCLIYVFTMNNFTLDYISLVSMLVLVLSYVMFNIFNIGAQKPMLKNIYLVAALVAFVPHFINKQDFSL